MRKLIYGLWPCLVESYDCDFLAKCDLLSDIHKLPKRKSFLSTKLLNFIPPARIQTKAGFEQVNASLISLDNNTLRWSYKMLITLTLVFEAA